MAKVKIVHLITAINLGGAEMMLYKLLTQADRTQFEPVVVSLMDCGTVGRLIKDAGIPVHTVGMKRGFPTPADLKRLVGIIRQVQPDIIHGWMYHGALAAQIASAMARRKIPIIWAIHHTIYSLSHETRVTRVTLRLAALLSRRPARIIFVSQTSRLQHEELGFDKQKSCVIPNGYDTAEFVQSADTKESVHAELGIPLDAILIGVIGRYHPMKDHANFIRAAAVLSRREPKTHYVLIGRELDPTNQALTKLIDQAGLAGRVHLLGERRDMPRIMAALDLMSSSSSHGEAFPMVIGEAMACATPCVVTDVGDSALLVGETGKVVPPRDAVALAAAWEQFITMGDQARRTKGLAARDRISQNYSLPSIVRTYEDLYRSVLPCA